MLIGELSNRTGVTRDTIRFYEKESLISPEKPGRGILVSNTYKNYSEATVATLLFIQRTKVLGFTLAEIRGMLELREPVQKSTKKWTVEAEEKLKAVDRKIMELQDLKKLLNEALTRCSDQCFDSGCEVLDTAVATRNASGARPAKAGMKPESGSCCS